MPPLYKRQQMLPVHQTVVLTTSTTFKLLAINKQVTTN